MKALKPLSCLTAAAGAFLTCCLVVLTYTGPYTNYRKDKIDLDESSVDYEPRFPALAFWEGDLPIQRLHQARRKFDPS